MDICKICANKFCHNPALLFRCDHCVNMYAKFRAVFFPKPVCSLTTDLARAEKISGLDYFREEYKQIREKNNGCKSLGCSSHCAGDMHYGHRGGGCDKNVAVYDNEQICHICLFTRSSMVRQCYICMLTKEACEFTCFNNSPQKHVCHRCEYMVQFDENKFAKKLTPQTFKVRFTDNKNGNPDERMWRDNECYYDIYELALSVFSHIVDRIGQKTFYREIYWGILDFALEDFLELMEKIHWQKIARLKGIL